jgi:hypothetical protein
VLNVISTEGLGKTEAVYASERAMQERGIAWPDADTARMVAEYRPEQEAVIAVPREGGGNSTYRMQRPGCAARGLSPARARAAQAVYCVSGYARPGRH